jgi:GTP-binding protein Era
LFILINKIDTSSQLELETAVQECSYVFPNQKIIPISALTGFFIPELLQMLIDLLPESPPYFPKDQLSDKSERFFVNESIRKSILENYDKEIPYAVEVVTESFKEEDKIIRIQSVILVERETQKGIVIGHKGEKLKKVGIDSRKDLASFFGKKIHIELFVKVQKNWRSNPQQLKRFGYHK